MEGAAGRERSIDRWIQIANYSNRKQSKRLSPACKIWSRRRIFVPIDHLEQISNLPSLPFFLKCDLKKDGLCKDQALIQESCRQFEFNEYFLVSAKTNRNVKESIMCLIKLIFDSRMEFTYNAGLIKLDESDEEPRSGFRCFC